VNVGFLAPGSGIERGFAAGYDYFPANQECPGNRASRFGRSAEQTNARVLAWLDGRGKGSAAPFLFLHYFDVHSDLDRLPYDSPPEYRQRFCGWYHGDFAGASAELNDLNEKQTPLPEDDLRYIQSLYDAGVAYTDEQVAALLDALRARGLYEDALIVLLADHGEEFREHGHLMHTQLYDECLRVPLLIKLPKIVHAGTRVPGQVGLVDVMPTLLELLGIERPSLIQGESLVARMHGGGAERPLTLSYCLNGALGLRETGSKLITHERWTDQLLLYDLKQDPGEKQNLAKRDQERAQQLLEHLHALRADQPDLFDASKPLGLSDEQRREMEKIGYPGGNRKPR
jgi:arylsulfatase A-like enzyme